MEELLASIVKEATGSKLQNLKQAAQIAHEKLSRQHGLHRDPSYELRSVCFTALQMALETKRPKFITYGLNGLHRIIRDERFFAGLEPEDDSLWLPAQLLRATSSLSTVANTEDTVVNVLRLILAMACSPTCTLNGRLLIEVLSRCGECWENGSRAVRAASLAAGSQCLRTFCAFLKDEAEEIVRLDPTGIISLGMAAAVYNEVIPVMQWLCSRLVEPSAAATAAAATAAAAAAAATANGNHRSAAAAAVAAITCHDATLGGGTGGNGGCSNSSLYLMECILTLVVSLPADVHANPHFTAFLWQKFCPTLAATMGSPGRVNKDKKFTYRDAIHLIESENRGFFTRPGLDGPQARCIYLTSIQLLRIAGAQGSLRPMLEALFHRMLLLPIPANRTEPLRYAREIFKSPERLIDLAIILYPDKSQSSSDDMALFRLVIDAMEECAAAWHNGSTSVYGALCSAVECIVALLESLQVLVSSGGLAETLVSERIAELVNRRYPRLSDADYSGPLTYQSMSRLPPPYRDAVAELRQNGYESSSDSDGDGGNGGGPGDHTIDPEVGSIGSGDTEGPEDEVTHSSGDEMSSRASQQPIWLWSHIEESSSATGATTAPTTATTTGGGRPDGTDCDRQHAREFAIVLTNVLVPALLKLKSSIEVDEAMQEFASKVCQQQQHCLNRLVDGTVGDHHPSAPPYGLTALNADGIYLATFSALLLALQLMKSGHYEASSSATVTGTVTGASHPGGRTGPGPGGIVIPLSEQQFVTSVQHSGILVYQSAGWLRELYQCILATNPLGAIGPGLVLEQPDGGHCALLDMLYDAGGFGPTQMLSDWMRLQSVVRMPNDERTAQQQAAKKIARRLLTCCWDSMVTVLTAGLGEAGQGAAGPGQHHRATGPAPGRLVKLSSVKRTLRVTGHRGDHQRGIGGRGGAGGETLYALSLDGLHAAATLSNALALQHLAGNIINLIACNVCQSAGPKIPASHALSMDVVLSGGLELGSHSADCWLPVFSVCRHVTQLEHDLFSSQNGAGGGGGGGSSNGGGGGAGTQCKDASEASSGGPRIGGGNGNTDKLHLSPYSVDEDETCIDVYSFLQAPSTNANVNVLSILKAYAGNDAVHLSPADTAKMLCALSHQADVLFAEAAERLALPALQQFLKSLCRASREQLYKSAASVKKRGRKSWWLGRPWKVKNDSLPLALLLHRVGDVTLKVFRGPRPLLHVLKVWAITGPHLMDAACHKDRSISKRAIEYIHDIITALLVEQTELPHFHFNEALLKPFENLLSADTCDADVQDQIVACLYEVVEAHRTEIRSGWRPLFGTLRTARNRPVHLANIIDIFRVFLETDNMLVFANAGLDCILCLLSYLEISGTGGGPGTGSSALGQTVPQTGGPMVVVPDGDELGGLTMRSGDFLYDALKFLERCATILDFMYHMPQCPNLHSTYKIKGISYTHLIDATIPSSMEHLAFFGQEYLHASDEQCRISYRALHIDRESEIRRLDELDRPSGVLKVWFLLLDGLTNSLIVCPIAHQSPILQSIFKIFKQLPVSPGVEFGFYCVNHLLIPMIQDWLRYVNKAQKSWALIEKNFKHCCCMTTDLVVDFLTRAVTGCSASATSASDHRVVIGSESQGHRTNDGKGQQQRQERRHQQQQQQQHQHPSPASTLALKQLLLVLIECSAQSQETIARVGVSCMKHILFSAGHLFGEEQWVIIASAIHRASTVSMAPLKQLIFAFNRNSNSFYGDCANVKVAARRDSTTEELQRIHSLAQQVFLMDCQREGTAGGVVGATRASNQQGGGSNTVGTPGTTGTVTGSGGIAPTTSGIGSNGLQEDRSYSFLLHPLQCQPDGVATPSYTSSSNSSSTTNTTKAVPPSSSSSSLPPVNGCNGPVDCYIIRIPYRNLIVGMLASQMLLQLIANVLLSGLSNVPSELNTCFYTSSGRAEAVSSASSSSSSSTMAAAAASAAPRGTGASTASKSPFQLGQHSKEILLRALRQFLASAIEFDSRPGLKFLLQKVSGIEYAANLYKQMNSSWIIQYMVLVDTYLSNVRLYQLDVADVRQALDRARYDAAYPVLRSGPGVGAGGKCDDTCLQYLLALRDLWELIAEHFINHLEHEPQPGHLGHRYRQTGSGDMAAGTPLTTTSDQPGHDGDHHVWPSAQQATAIEEECSPVTPKADTAGRQQEQAKELESLHQQQQQQQQQHYKQLQDSTPQPLTPLAERPKSVIPPEIEQQRAHSIQRDVSYKTSALRQLIVASIELIKLLPDEQSDYLQLLLTPTIREAFRYVEENQQQQPQPQQPQQQHQTGASLDVVAH
ncbi:brefeldin A-inhibited guanine nucleotide-exchange protein 3 [Anopheles darlingi]|uniref:brefeldin A-inhibited guanine nucleotide-exchange protein 3 n=1 Tax=Anopheles darlingi TaxID=43151 RepID=UPI00210045E2|nr:brefeldin A-inhibited guanine nucleotide-exchange protein 3 [Anopheles darlingi]XP_049546138.1 brefeldin A-inhibited guanine nucleotide-exchange protein 3 [Anopheles darlingi]